MARNLTRRTFMAAATATVTAAGLSTAGAAGAAPEANPGATPGAGAGATPGAADKPALLGGTKVRTQPFPAWPVIDDTDEQALLKVLRSRKWFRGYGDTVNHFEQEYAALIGAKHCIATANGTSALHASLGGLGIGPGDEVILSPYTFIATLNAVLLQFALPIFVDTDPRTFQIDARKIEAALTPRTAAIVPVHIGGAVADLDTILAVARKRSLPVVEDACQAHLAEWRGRRAGSWGATGCFSFQASKNLNAGEGGAVVTNDADLAQKVYAFHNNCRGRSIPGYHGAYLGTSAADLRMTEFQAGLLLAQMTRLEAQSKTRELNAQYLTKLLREIPGIEPAELHEGCTRNAWHLFMLRYRAERFANLPRAKFLKALSAEGIPCSSGYGAPLNQEPFLKACLESKGYQRIYGAKTLADWAERNQCPANDQLCQEGVWFFQTMLLGPRRDMYDIAEAIGRIRRHAAALAQA